MSANILSPLLLWRNFSLDKQPRLEIVSSKTKGDVILNKVYVDGKTTKLGTVKIYGILAKEKDVKKAPGIIVFTGNDNLDMERIALSIVKRGYQAFVVNLYGKKEGEDRVTLYPDDIDYANYENSKDTLWDVKKDVVHTCWYEWCVAGRYAFDFFKNYDGVTGVGAVGIKEFATVMWQLAANEKDLICASSIFGFGWEMYKGIHKFGDKLEPQFTDQQLMFVAGIEPESYSQHVKCPVMVLTSTNSVHYDVDRAFDTVSRIKEDVFTSVDYSVNYAEALSYQAIKNSEIFFGDYLKNKGKVFSKKKTDTEFTVEVKDGKITFNLDTTGVDVAKVVLYVAEENVEPDRRCWIHVDPTSFEKDNATFIYHPFDQSSKVMFFAKIFDDAGFSFSTNVNCKKFSAKEISVSHKNNVVYSGREKNSQCVFAPYYASSKFITKEDEEVLVKNGPMGIYGVYSPLGLITYKINAKKYKPQDDGIFMFDVYSKEENFVTVKLVVKSHGVETHYFSTVKISGGKVWYNIKIEKSKFKTEQGMILKSYDKVRSIIFDFEKSCLINNALWV